MRTFQVSAGGNRRAIFRAKIIAFRIQESPNDSFGRKYSIRKKPRAFTIVRPKKCFGFFFLSIIRRIQEEARMQCDTNLYSRRVTAYRNFRGGSLKTMTASSRCHRHSHIDHARGKQVSGRNLSNENFQLPDTFSSSQNHALFR